MPFKKSISFACVFLGLFLGNFFTPFHLNAASALAAWVINEEGVLQFRTSRGAKLKAFFQGASNGKGERVWVDFPGELIRPRTLPGNGPIKEIRLGKPRKGITRFVVEFDRYVDLKPSQLKLRGIAPNKWELRFIGLPTRGLTNIGEGNIIRAVNRSFKKKDLITNSRYEDLIVSNLPSVPKNRFLIVIDPGHGGPDPGAIGIGGLRESEVVLEVSREVSRFLYMKGVDVRLTRNSEIDVDLPPRVNMANKIKADAFISIHANASRGFQRHINGLETYYFSGYKGFRLATNIQNEILKAAPSSPDRGVRKGRFFVIRGTKMPAALVEIGFVTGRDDSQFLSQSKHRKKLAFAISKGILKYLKETY